jgi:anti-sigma regulatory factor (Ser/Thr protein kinase)
MTRDHRQQPQTPGRPPGEPEPQAARPGAPDANVATILSMNFDAGSLYALRSAVAAHATQAGMPEVRADDVVLAVHEFAVNAVRHGAGHGRLVIRKHDGALLCQVADDGAPQAATGVTRSGTQTAASYDDPWPSRYGRGLWMVRQVADHLSVRTGPQGTTAAVSFAFPAPGQQRPEER